MRRGRYERDCCRVLIVDDHPAVREGLAWRIDLEPGMELCGQASGVRDALTQIERCHPDVAVIDISLRDGNGIDLIRRLKDSPVRLLAWSMHPDNLYAERVIRAGALGYVNKELSTAKLLEAIRAVQHNELYLSPEVTQQVLGRLCGDRHSNLSPVEQLSNRELEIFGLIGEGYATCAIADKLGISVHTVETHRQRIKSKLGISGSTELMCQATRWQLEQEG